MKIAIDRNGQQFGPYTVEEVNAYLLSGNIVGSDMACPQGGSQWVPVSSIEGVVLPPPPPPPREVERNALVLVVMGVVWFLIFWFGVMILLGLVVGVMHAGDSPERVKAAANSVAVAAAVPIFLLTLCLSIALTYFGKLPGTRNR